MLERENERQSKSEKKKPEHRTRKISFRLSEAEYAQIENDLAISCLNISTLVRKRLLQECVISHADLAVLNELRRLGGLLKHIHNETLGAYSHLTAQAIKNLSAYARALADERQNNVFPEEASQ